MTSRLPDRAVSFLGYASYVTMSIYGN